MEQELPPKPPAYQQHDPNTLNLPSVPTHNLPSLRSLDLPDATPHQSTRAGIETSPKTRSEQWGHLPPMSSSSFPRAPDGEVGSPMDTSSVVSGHEERGIMSVEEDVRLAAEALSGLGNPDYSRSPTARSMTFSARESTTEPEPLLNLVTSAHPWLGGSINGSISAYNATKGYSPRFVQYGAELIERNIGSPMVNTISSVGRRTGVEKNLRRYLGEVPLHRRPSDLEQGDTDAARKRQRIMSPHSDAMDIEDTASSRTRGGSQSSYTESLPAYDDYRSPKYEETAVLIVDPAAGKEADRPSSRQQDQRNFNWGTQLIMTTSGLGVALSDASLRSLKLCLGLLRGATKHIDNVMHALKLVLEEYENALRNDGSATRSSDIAMTSGQDADREARVRRIADRMKQLSSDIWTTLQNVVQSVSRYTGGALPQNASQVVRTQLLSVPQRWQLATRSTANEQQNGRGAEVQGANRMLAFAKEGLDMIGQITTVVDGTVMSAESWLARIGRGNGSQRGESSQVDGKAPLVEVVVKSEKN